MQSSPFESLLDDRTQAAPDRPAQAASDDDAPRTDHAKSPNPPAQGPSAKPGKAAKTAKAAGKVKSADAGKTAKTKTKPETPDGEFRLPIDVKATTKPVNQITAPGDDKPIDGKPVDGKPADDKPVDVTPVDGSSVDVNPADLPAPDKLGAAISDIAQSPTNPVAAAVAGPVLAPTTPKPAAEAIDHAAPIAPFADAAAHDPQVAPKSEIKDNQAPPEKPADIAALETDSEISAPDKETPVKVTPTIQDNGKTKLSGKAQLVVDDAATRKLDEQGDSQAGVQTNEQTNSQAEKPAGKPTDKQPDTQQVAQSRNSILVDTHRGAPADAPGPTSTNAQPALPNAGADIAQTQSLTMPSHAGSAPATNPSAALPSQLPPQAAAIPLAGVALEIAGKALAGKNRFDIRLDPPELGRIEVRLDVDRDGNVTSRLVADRADTLDLLRRDAAGLERALQDAGLKTSDNGLQFSLRDQSAGQEQRQSGPDAAHLVVRDETVAANDAIVRDYYRRIGPSGGLDIRV